MPDITARIGETLLFENGTTVSFVAVDGEAVRMVVNRGVLGRQTARAKDGRQNEPADGSGDRSAVRKRWDA